MYDSTSKITGKWRPYLERRLEEMKSATVTRHQFSDGGVVWEFAPHDHGVVMLFEADAQGNPMGRSATLGGQGWFSCSGCPLGLAAEQAQAAAEAAGGIKIWPHDKRAAHPAHRLEAIQRLTGRDKLFVH